ncbi:MAG: hypothetical protein M1275_01345 [Patescibacteria group bacterium]|nr:hypothetical protein [Patescibacteria group bacterium]
MSSKQKKRFSRWSIGLGALALIIGFFPGWLPWQLGIVIFVFCLVAAGIVHIIIPEPDPLENQPNGESHVDKVLTTGVETGNEKTGKLV